jgi:hypothetical protein
LVPVQATFASNLSNLAQYPIRHMKPYSPLSSAPLRLVQRVLAVILCTAIAPLALGDGQDYWERYSQKKLAVPDTATLRKCITISKDGIYVGKMNPAGNAAVSIEQYTLAGAFVKNWTTAFTNIGGLASDAEGSVYVFDQGVSKVLIFDANGVAIRNFGSAGSDDGQFSAASGFMVQGIAVDTEKNIYIADYGNSRVQKFSPTGTFQLKFGVKGDLPGQFRDGPNAVAATPQGTVITSDAPAGWYHLSIFSAEGKLMRRGVQGNGSNESRYHSGDWGFGAFKSFAVSADGVLMLGRASGGYSYGFSTATIEYFCNLQFPNDVEIRGGAFDASGNFWAVRDKEVHSLQRRMRFDAHIPTKALPQPVITKISQVPGSKIVDIDFKVADSDTASVTTALAAFVDGTRSWQNLVIPRTFTGATSGRLGAGVPSGGAYRVNWDASVDMPGKNFATLSFRILASDGRPGIGVHYVTIPADSTNPYPLKISIKQMPEDDLWDLWLWLLATGDPRVAVSGNSVVLTTAGQAYLAGAPVPTAGPSTANVAHNGSSSTVQGRAFACKLLGCRPATAVEVTRARAGRYNLIGVDHNSVVLPNP